MSTKLANPAPLDLMGFGMTTILLNIHNAGFFPIDSMILAMGIFYGGLSQVLVGMMCFKRGDTFGTTAFTSYGLFWLTLVSTNRNALHGSSCKPSTLYGLVPTAMGYLHWLHVYWFSMLPSSEASRIWFSYYPVLPTSCT